ncbi:TetR/AcrR family transcriptional regulator [Rhizorhabdus argentea]|uniref:TetR/AcrR family transcriptional regulator n=1 Tax=Rhizorhabdus argentea TaxID=1387174 RepID=UPI0030EE5B01
MVKTAAAALRQEERAERRRNQVLDAARACVIADGFHGATISQICAKASMTVGHIYKIFESKEAIMIALCQRDFEEWVSDIERPLHSAIAEVDAFVERYLEDMALLLDPDRAALAQEVLTEAARNPKVNELVEHVDGRLRSIVRNIATPVWKGLSEKEIEGRIETVLIMTRALALHSSTHQHVDRETIATGFEIALRAVLSPPAADRRAKRSPLGPGPIG